VIAATTIVRAAVSACSASQGTVCSRSASFSAIVAPPYTLAMTLTSVIPTWTVERKSPGLAEIANAARAPESPRSACRWSRTRFAATIASSDIEKTPLSSNSTAMMTSSRKMSDMVISSDGRLKHL
jgi:hypothetical protein